MLITPTGDPRRSDSRALDKVVALGHAAVRSKCRNAAQT
jgi:hypothetical protein